MDNYCSFNNVQNDLLICYGLIFCIMYLVNSHAPVLWGSISLTALSKHWLDTCTDGSHKELATEIPALTIEVELHPTRLQVFYLFYAGIHFGQLWLLWLSKISCSIRSSYLSESQIIQIIIIKLKKTIHYLFIAHVSLNNTILCLWIKE